MSNLFKDWDKKLFGSSELETFSTQTPEQQEAFNWLIGYLQDQIQQGKQPYAAITQLSTQQGIDIDPEIAQAAVKQVAQTPAQDGGAAAAQAGGEAGRRRQQQLIQQYGNRMGVQMYEMEQKGKTDALDSMSHAGIDYTAPPDTLSSLSTGDLTDSLAVQDVASTIRQPGDELQSGGAYRGREDYRPPAGGTTTTDTSGRVEGGPQTWEEAISGEEFTPVEEGDYTAGQEEEYEYVAERTPEELSAQELLAEYLANSPDVQDSGARATLEQIMRGATAEGATEMFGEMYDPEYQRMWSEDIMPQLSEQFAATGGLASSDYREELGEAGVHWGGQRMSHLGDVIQSMRQDALYAAERMPGVEQGEYTLAQLMAEEPLRRAQAGMQYGGLPRHLRQEEMSSRYNEYLRTQEGAADSISQLINLLGQTTQGGYMDEEEGAIGQISDLIASIYGYGSGGGGIGSSGGAANVRDIVA